MVGTFPSFAKRVLSCAVGLSLAACSAEEAGTNEGTGEDDLTALSLKITGTEDTVVTDKPALVAGAEGSLACAERFELAGRVRLGCTRGKEILEVIVDAAAKKAVVVHRPIGRGVDKRAFYACTTSGNGPGDLPSTLKCNPKTPTTHGPGLASPFAPTAPGMTIPNAHVVGKEDLLLRGMAPRTEEEMGQLFSSKIGAVLLFKNQTGKGNDVAEEMAELEKRGIPGSRILNVPFAWKELTSFEAPCKQTIEALAFVEANVSAKKKTFFHCTVGEDRTGFLAAMRRMLVDAEMTPERAFDEEMCENGYGSGNPLKPAFVVGALEAESGLTPLYQRMAYLVATKKITAAKLDAAVCKTDPAKAADFAKTALPMERLRCGTSTKFALAE